MEVIYKENHRDRGKRRKDNYKKAIRKRKISESKLGKNNAWYEHLGQYIKGKIHCSCPLCTAYSKTNTKGKWCKGKKNYKISDQKIIDSMNEQMKEVLRGERS